LTPLRTWPIVALALAGLLTLIGVSVLAARSKAEAAYAALDTLNTQSRNLDSQLRRVRSDLHLSGILARDYLLDTSNAGAPEYRLRFAELRDESRQVMEELARSAATGGAPRLETLDRRLNDYWKSYDPLFAVDGTPADGRYAFLLREIVPRRDAVIAISAEIEAINTANVRAQREAALARQRELHLYLTGTLLASLTLGAAVAVAAVVRIRLLERRAAEQHARTEEAEQEMRRLSNQLVRAQEEERKGLSRELHDELGQMLTALRMELGRGERALALGSPAFAATLTESKLLIDQMMRLVRDLAMGLRPSMLDDLGLEPALAWQSRDFSRRYNVPVNLTVTGDLDRLPDVHRTCVYRVVQEALTNCAKHAGATSIDVSVTGGADRLEVSVEDNGVGLPPRPRQGGLGLTGIKERVRELSGSAFVQSRANGGTALHITLPVPAAAPAGSKESRLAHSTG
jgi:signal transduction histidine kinase